MDKFRCFFVFCAVLMLDGKSQAAPFSANVDVHMSLVDEFGFALFPQIEDSFNGPQDPFEKEEAAAEEEAQGNPSEGAGAGQPAAPIDVAVHVEMEAGARPGVEQAVAGGEAVDAAAVPPAEPAGTVSEGNAQQQQEGGADAVPSDSLPQEASNTDVAPEQEGQEAGQSEGEGQENSESSSSGSSSNESEEQSEEK